MSGHFTVQKDLQAEIGIQIHHSGVQHGRAAYSTERNSVSEVVTDLTPTYASKVYIRHQVSVLLHGYNNSTPSRGVFKDRFVASMPGGAHVVHTVRPIRLHSEVAMLTSHGLDALSDVVAFDRPV